MYYPITRKRKGSKRKSEISLSRFKFDINFNLIPIKFLSKNFPLISQRDRGKRWKNQITTIATTRCSYIKYLKSDSIKSFLRLFFFCAFPLIDSF